MPSARRIILTCLHLLACVSFGSRARGSHSYSSQVVEVRLNTKQGRIRGLAEHFGGDITYTKFLGIPYAVPPTGARRFKEPLKHPGWALNNEWNSTYYRPFCISNSAASRPSHPIHTGYHTSEDCLYLNLYIPRNLSSIRHVNILGLPVMVYLHGWTAEDGIDRVDSSWSMAGAGDLIIAQVNYRVGVFGFLSLQDRLALGNFGLHDQRMAMHWIWDNIREFGGNPERITLIGAGTGAACVSLHMLAPLSRGIFTRAIGQSATSLSPGIFQEDALSNAFDLARELGCPTENYQALISCLRLVPVEDLRRASTSSYSMVHHWLPVVDHSFIPDYPIKLLDQGSFNPVDYLTGINSHEGYSLLVDYDIDLDSLVSKDDFEDIIGYCVSQYYSQNVDFIRQTITAEYTGCEQTDAARKRALVDFLTDFHYVMPADLAARLMTKRGERKVFLYEFSHKPSFSQSARGVDYVKAVRGDEFDFVMGQMASGTTQEHKLSQTLQDTWINFAKFGDPNPVVPGLLWKQYVASSGDYVTLDTSLSGSSARMGLRSRQMSLLNGYVHELSKSSPCDMVSDQCERVSRPIRQSKEQVSVALGVLAAACVILLVLIIFLLCKVRLAPEKWKKVWSCFDSKPQKKKKKQQLTREQERKKLHPLPYYDEPT